MQKWLLSSGVSKKKLEEAEKDLTYSMMLNLVLVALAPADRKPNMDLLGAMNRARSLRNEYMHNGQLPNNLSEITRLYEKTTEFVLYLRELDRDLGESGRTA